MLEFTEDFFNGLTIKTPIKSCNFVLDLKELIKSAELNDKNLIWLTLSSSDGFKIASALELGFKFHSCSESELVLVLKLKDVFVPFMPTHTVGVGGVVVADGKILMVQERLKSHRSKYKIPGGMVELGSSLEESIIREVYEETGIKTKLEKMIGVLHTHPYRFDKSNIYYIFKLLPLNVDIDINDVSEIALAIWYDLDKFFTDDKISTFQKEIVSRAIDTNGFKRQACNYFQTKNIVELYI